MVGRGNGGREEREREIEREGGVKMCFLNGRSLSVSGLWHFTCLEQTLLAEALK